MTPADKALLARAGITLPPAPPPIGTFLPAIEIGGLLHVSGQAPLDAEGQPMTGPVETVGLPQARARAGRTALALLASISLQPGRLARIRRPLRLLTMVNAGPDFTRIDEVADGASDIFNRLFPQGHARTSIALPALPNMITVEIEAVFDIAQK